MLFEQPGIALLVREKDKFFCARLSNIKERFCQQPAKFPPIWVRLIKTVKILVRDEENFRIFHRLNKIPAGVACYKAPERNDKLIFREKVDILIFFCIGVAIINPEYAFDYQAEVIANHLLHVEEIPFIHFSRFPEGPAVADVFIVQRRKISQVLENYIVCVSHLMAV